MRDHLQDTALAGRLIFSDTRVGRNFCRAFKLDSDETVRFLLNLEIACLFHDIGKANEGFLNAVLGKPNSQVVRHEHLSAMILQLPEISSWLSFNSEINLDIITAAVLSHHLKAPPGEIGRRVLGCAAEACDLFLNHDEVKHTLEQVAQAAHLNTLPQLTCYKVFHIYDKTWVDCIEKIETKADNFRWSLREDNESSRSKRKLVAALKTALIVADSVASGVIREGGKIANWIAENVHLKQLTEKQLRQSVIEPCTDSIAKRSGKPYSPAPFQVAASKLGSSSALLAGCGAGKTLAGLLWAANQLATAEFGRVIFLYPTRGTATEGFKDYIGWAPENEATLLHGSARYSLECITENPPESALGKDYRKETVERLFSLQHYSRRFFSATVDQFLSFLQYNYSSLCLVPLLTDSVVVIDEVHSFDPKLFNTLLEYLRSMRIPTLCMTATLQKERVEEMRTIGMQFFPSDSEREEFADLAEKESHVRHRISRLTDEGQALEIARAACGRGAKVLWVVNTVARCQNLAKQLEAEFGDQIICYHSRFKQLDREQKHKQCVEKFRFDATSEAVCAVTTQVCEMSLDLDAEVLISEFAPIPSLIQRLGRANRHYEKRISGFIAPVYFYSAKNEKPYERKDIEDADQFVDWLLSDEQGLVSQTRLSFGMEKFAEKAPPMQPFAWLFESGYFAVPKELRDIDEFAVPSILDGDLEEAHSLLLSGQTIDALIVSVPPDKYAGLSRPAWLPQYLQVASSTYYTPSFGFSTK